MIPEPAAWPAVPPPDDPVEFWLQRARCCGSPQSCGALCMDSEASQTEAAVVRRVDEAEAACARLSALAEECQTRGRKLQQVPALRLVGNAYVGTAERIRLALAGEEQ